MRFKEEIKNLLKAGDKQRALALLIEALKAEPNDVDAWWLLSFAVAERDKPGIQSSQT
jgi:Flp pilus assembly protein TadD